MLNNDIQKTIDEAAWRTVPDQALAFAKKAALQALEVLEILAELPGRGCVYYLPVEKCAYVYGPKAAKNEWERRIATIKNLDVVSGPDQQPGGIGPWACFEKSALQARSVFGPIASLAGWKPGPVASLFGGPNTLSATIGTGLLGAGIGYGAGWLGETLAGRDNLKRGRLRRTLAMLGGLGGAVPALWAGLRGWHRQPMQVQASANPLKEGYDALVVDLPDNDYIEELEKQGFAWLPGVGVADNINRIVDPTSFSTSGAFGQGYFDPVIPTDNLNQMIWNDPMTPTQIRAGASGLLTGAQAMQGGNTWVSPADIGRIAMGMGSGYVSGKIVGKALGALAGLQPQTQQRLQQAGTWAGFLSNVIPKAFGG